MGEQLTVSSAFSVLTFFVFAEDGHPGVKMSGLCTIIAQLSYSK